MNYLSYYTFACAMFNLCSAAPCVNTVGTKLNSYGACECGSSSCTPYSYCIGSLSICIPHKKYFLPAFFAVDIVNGNVASTPNSGTCKTGGFHNRVPIDNPSMCLNLAKYHRYKESSGFKGDTRGTTLKLVNSDSDPPGCFYVDVAEDSSSSGVKRMSFNVHPTGSYSKSENVLICVRLLNPHTCPNTNGINVIPCDCGNTLCEKQGMKCHAASSTCSFPVCTHRKGLTPNASPCTCGGHILHYLAVDDNSYQISKVQLGMKIVQDGATGTISSGFGSELIVIKSNIGVQFNANDNLVIDAAGINIAGSKISSASNVLQTKICSLDTGGLFCHGLGQDGMCAHSAETFAFELVYGGTCSDALSPTRANIQGARDCYQASENLQIWSVIDDNLKSGLLYEPVASNGNPAANPSSSSTEEVQRSIWDYDSDKGPGGCQFFGNNMRYQNSLGFENIGEEPKYGLKYNKAVVTTTGLCAFPISGAAESFQDAVSFSSWISMFNAE